MGVRKPAPGRRTDRRLELDRLLAGELARLGRELAAARKRRRLTQEQLAVRCGISRSAVSRLELGLGHGVPLETLYAIALELGLSPRLTLGRDWREEPADAGHLGIQELLIRLGRSSGYAGTFELPVRPGDPQHSVDVFLRSDRRRRLVVAEAWNVIGDVGAGARSFDRKLALARELAVAIGRERPYDVHGVWVVRATRRNRALVARYPELFASKFPGSSRRWVEALTHGTPPPAEPGLVWCGVRGTRLFAWRRPGPAPDGA